MNFVPLSATLQTISGGIMETDFMINIYELLMCDEKWKFSTQTKILRNRFFHDFSGLVLFCENRYSLGVSGRLDNYLFTCGHFLNCKAMLETDLKLVLEKNGDGLEKLENSLRFIVAHHTITRTRLNWVLFLLFARRRREGKNTCDRLPFTNTTSRILLGGYFGTASIYARII